MKKTSMDGPIYNLADGIRFRKAGNEDIEASTMILREAAQEMMASGKKQWDDLYPTLSHVISDIEQGAGYVLELDGEIIGYCAIFFDGEPAYMAIDGEWLSDKPYIVVHRMAVSANKKGAGLGKIFMETAEKYARDSGVLSFKVDTNFDNFAMLGLLEKLGFSYCGEICYQEGKRKAFEKLLQ